MRRSRWLRFRLGLVGGCALLCMPLAHAQEALRDIPFVDLGQGESTTAGAAMLLVADSDKQATELARVADRPDLVAQRAALDAGQRRLVGVFVGPMGHSGHGLAVRAVSAGVGTVRITVELMSPRPEQNVSDVISYPYALIAVPVTGLPWHGVWSVVSTDGRKLITSQR
jgi:hypothetical protein